MLSARGLVASSFLGLVLCLGATSIGATTVYTYTGNSFDTFGIGGMYNGSMSLSGTVELSSAITANTTNANLTAQIVSFSFFDGVQTITEATAGTVLFRATTNGAGDIVDWFFSWQSGFSSVLTCDPGTTISVTSPPCSAGFVYDNGMIDFADSGGNVNNPGVWVVPEPGTAGLVALGLVGLCLRRRRS